MHDGRELEHAQVVGLFKHFDCNDDGAISSREFRQVATAMGADPSAEELTTVIEVFDKDGDGQVSYAEFLWFLGMIDTTDNPGNKGTTRKLSTLLLFQIGDSAGFFTDGY